MSKELEFLDKIYFAETNEGRLELFFQYSPAIKKALKRLEAIDNANPSEALKLVEELDNCLISDMSIEVDDYDESNYCMSYEYVDFNGEGLQFNDDIKEETIIDFIREKKISTIKQALLKAQEPKQYLKWEDLEFKKEEQTMKVLLNGERYLIKYVNEWFCGWCSRVQITNGTYILCTLGNGMNQFFNDLHLEVLE